MGTKMAVSFANIFMAKIETTLIQQSETKAKEWRRYIDDILPTWGGGLRDETKNGCVGDFSLWDGDKKDKKDEDQFTEEGKKFHPTIKFAAEISDNDVSSKNQRPVPLLLS